jgi:hypothetical protein
VSDRALKNLLPKQSGLLQGEHQRARLGMEGKTPDQIAEGVQAAYARGELPRLQ